MTRREKWEELHPTNASEFDRYHRCPYWDLDIEEYDCDHEELVCEECWEKEYETS